MINWLPVKVQGGWCSECNTQIGHQFGELGEGFIYGTVDKNTLICPACLKKKNPVEVTIGDTTYQQTNYEIPFNNLESEGDFRVVGIDGLRFLISQIVQDWEKGRELRITAKQVRFLPFENKPECIDVRINETR